MNDNSSTQSDSLDITPRAAPKSTWIYAAAIMFYAAVAALGTLYYRWEPGLDVAIIPLAIAVWMEYLYLRYRNTGSHQGLMISGLGWLAVAIAFVLRGSGSPVGLLRTIVALAGLLAILGGGIRAFMETRTLDEAGDSHSTYSPAETSPRNDQSTGQPHDATPGGSGFDEQA